LSKKITAMPIRIINHMRNTKFMFFNHFFLKDKKAINILIEKNLVL